MSSAIRDPDPLTAAAAKERALTGLIRMATYGSCRKCDCWVCVALRAGAEAGDIARRLIAAREGPDAGS